MIGISIYILADTYFISVYAGADGLAVLNLILPVYGVMYAVGALIEIGSATRYGIDKATGKNTDTCFLHSLLWSLLCSIPFVLVGIFSPFFICNYTFTAFARNDHATSTSMLGSIAGSMFNIVFDYVFMFSLHLGLAGAALATGFCPDVTMLICSTHFLGKHNQVGFHRPHLSIRRLIDCCKLGVSAFVGEIFSGVITIIFNMLILGIASNMGCLHLSGSGTADRRCKLAVYRSPGKYLQQRTQPETAPLRPHRTAALFSRISRRRNQYSSGRLLLRHRPVPSCHHRLPAPRRRRNRSLRDCAGSIVWDCGSMDLFPCVGNDYVCCGGFTGEEAVRPFCVLNLSISLLRVSTRVKHTLPCL